MGCKYTFKKYRGVMFDGTEDWYLIEKQSLLIYFENC